jgi:hypothetical protein
MTQVPAEMRGFFFAASSKWPGSFAIFDVATTSKLAALRTYRAQAIAPIKNAPAETGACLS